MAGAAAAMEQLFSIYWYPIYAAIRRKRGLSHHDAEDMTQGFFAHLLEYDTLTRATQEDKRFRNYLLAVLDKFMANKHAAANALKRGGGQTTFSLDAALANELYACEPAVPPVDDKVYDREWAKALVRQVLARLKNEYEQEGDGRIFSQLGLHLTDPVAAVPYARCAADLGMQEGAVRVAMHRLRRRFGELLRGEIAQTVSDKDDIDDELRHLIAALMS